MLLLLPLPLAFNQITGSHQLNPLPCSKLLHGLLHVRGQNILTDVPTAVGHQLLEKNTGECTQL